MAALEGAVITGEVYAWVVVFLLPVNSAINPLLYTISAIKTSRKSTQKTKVSLQNSLSVKGKAGEVNKFSGKKMSTHLKGLNLI